MPIRLFAVALLATLAAQAPLSTPAFDYDAKKPIDVQFAEGAGASIRQLTYAKLDGTRNPATLVTRSSSGEQGRPAQPAVLFVHWYRAAATDLQPDGVSCRSGGAGGEWRDVPPHRHAVDG